MALHDPKVGPLLIVNPADCHASKGGARVNTDCVLVVLDLLHHLVGPADV